MSYATDDSYGSFGRLAASRTSESEEIGTTSNDGLGSTPKAFVNFTKQMFGAGVLALPHAFTWSGLWAGIVVYALVLASCCYSQILLIKCINRANWLRYNERVTPGIKKRSLGTYTELSDFVFGRKAGVAVAIMVVIIELLFCSGWVIVACTQLSKETGLSHTWLALIVFPVISLLTCIPYLSDMWFLSFFGLFIYIVGIMGSVYVHIGIRTAAGDAHIIDYAAVRWSTLPRFIGTAVYGLEAILMVIPVTCSMRNERAAVWVVGCGTALYAITAVVFGVVAYLHGYGSCESISECLDHGITTHLVRYGLAVVMIVGYPVILFPVSNTLEARLLTKPTLPSRKEEDEVIQRPESEWKNASQGARTAACRYRVKQVGLRVGCVGLTCIIAAIFDNISLFSSLVGAFLVTQAGFIIPPLIHWKLSRRPQVGVHRGSNPELGPHIGTNCLTYALDVFLIIFGIGACVIGTQSAVVDIVAKYKK